MDKSCSSPRAAPDSCGDRGPFAARQSQRTRIVPLAIVVGWFLAPCGSAAAANPATPADAELALALRDRIEEFHQTAEFLGHATLTRGLVKSVEDGLAGRNVVKPKKAEHFVVQLGDAVRSRIKEIDPGAWPDFDRDESAAGDVCIWDIYDAKQDYRYVQFIPRENPNPGQAVGPQSPAGHGQPLQLMKVGESFNPFPVDGGGRPRPPTEVRRDGDRVTFLFALSAPGDALNYREELTLRTDLSPPATERIELHWDDAKQGPLKITAVASDFVEVPGGWLPRTVRTVGYAGPDGLLDYWEWSCPDLGEIEPTGEDFSIEVPAGIDVDFLKAGPEETVELTRFHPADYTLADLELADPPALSIESGAVAVPGTNWAWPLLIGGGSALLLTFGVLGRRKGWF